MTASLHPADSDLVADNLTLDSLTRGSKALVRHVRPVSADDLIARRLEDLGFVAGEPLRVIARGPFGGDPLVVQVGYTRFALRLAEAARVHVGDVEVHA